MATLRFDNPFHDLWVTEILDANAYVKMFSPVLINDAEELFSTANVVLKGRQGSGKSMLLNLLQTSTRVAYDLEGEPYPVPPKQKKFISAGVQLTQENAALIANRAGEFPEGRREQTLATNFADYLNSLLCLDLLRNIVYLASEQAKNSQVLKEVPVNLSTQCQKELFLVLKESQTWPDFISSNCTDISQALRDLEERLRTHRRYLNGNFDTLPSNIEKTRASAGEPISELASALRVSGVLPHEILVLIRIDQHEELFELERHSGLGNIFRKVINSALSRRDPNVAYRIGTRHYAWENEQSCWGSGAPLEVMRDYTVIDLDYILRRSETVKGWKFPILARDVLEKRLKAAGFKFVGDPMEILFGHSLEPAVKARWYAGQSKCPLRFEDGWAPEWKGYLESLWLNNEPLEAKFGEAWLRQEIPKRRRIPYDGKQAAGFPWRKQWWVKERNEIALMQIAGDRQQALMWSGERQIIDLSGHNILAFMTICKSIWATWQRRNADAADNALLPTFSIDDQAIGINEASQLWFQKIQVGPEADQRARLVSALGGWFRQRMLKDRALSNPGHNGFSLSSTEFNDNSPLISLIKTCRDHGDLIESAHTTKNKDQSPRIKWYLHPLLCPIFRIPHVRTKEPIYTSLNELQLIYLSQKRHGPVADEMITNSSEVQLGLPGI